MFFIHYLVLIHNPSNNASLYMMKFIFSNKLLALAAI